MATIRHERSPGGHRCSTGLSVALTCFTGLVFAFPFLGGIRCRAGAGTARVVHMAAQQRQASNASVRCPTYADVVDDRLLEPETDTGSLLQIRCTASDVVVRWAGPDAKFETVDDETVPDPLSPWPPLKIATCWPAALVAPALGLSMTLLALLAVTLRSARANLIARLASLAGWSLIALGFLAGAVDLTLAHAAAQRTGLGSGDALRARTRGKDAFVFEACLGFLVGAPGAALSSLAWRRRRHRSRARAPVQVGPYEPRGL